MTGLNGKIPIRGIHYSADLTEAPDRAVLIT
jgi:hypothetical protein